MMASNDVAFFCLITAALCVSTCFTKPTTPAHPRGLPNVNPTTIVAGKPNVDTSELTTSGIDVDTLNKNTIGYRRLRRFYSKNSGNFIRINKTEIDGMGKITDSDAKLLVETVRVGEITIKSYKWGYYLCLNTNGSVVSLPTLPTGKARAQCTFYQDQTQGYTVFKSVLNTNWYLAITKAGKPKNAKKTSNIQRAAHFLEY